MYSVYIKRIVKVDIPTQGKTPQELIEAAKKKDLNEELISDTFLIEDEEGIIVCKEKVKHDGKGKSFVQTDLRG